LALSLSLGQGADDVGEGGEVDAAPGLGGFDAECRGKVAFAGAGRPEEVDHFGAIDEVELCEFAGYKLLITDEPGYVPLSQTGAELLFELFSQRYERGSVTSNLPFDEWTGVFASERLTGTLLDRLTHHVHILEMNGDSYRLNQSICRARRA
jgi:hypothetical protein